MSGNGIDHNCSIRVEKSIVVNIRGDHDRITSEIGLKASNLCSAK